MAKYWTSSIQYSQMNAEELQKKARESVLSAKNKGKTMHPIVIEGKGIAKSWWGQGEGSIVAKRNISFGRFYYLGF